MTAPIKTCNYCRAVGVMPTFMNGETVCYDCLQTLPKTLLEAWREIASLRAKIEQMERQEPVAWRTFDGEGGYDYRSYEDNENYKLGWDARNPNHIGWVEPLYALPGAQPAPSMPEVTDAMALAFHHALTDGSIGAREVEEIKDALRAALAAAPKLEGE